MVGWIPPKAHGLLYVSLPPGGNVPRPRVKPDELREKVSISPDRRILAWIDANTGLGKRFNSRTHAFEWCVAQVMDQGEGALSDRRKKGVE